MTDVKNNKLLLVFVIIIVLAVVGYLFWRNQATEMLDGENIPLPPSEEESLSTFKGKIYSTPEGSQFDDYLVTQDGQEYGLEAGVGKMILVDQIESLRDSGKTVEIEGKITEDVSDYGGRQIVVNSLTILSEEEDDQDKASEEDDEDSEGNTGLANPAAVYCLDQGGELRTEETEKGQISMCVFEEGECEEWAFFRGECTPEEGNVTLQECGEEYEDADVCTAEFDPVCARVIEGNDAYWETYSNVCKACIANKTISGYKEDECEESK